MLRKTIGATLILLLIFMCGCSDIEGFRGMQWGSSQEYVKKREKVELDTESHLILRYQGTTVAGHAVESFAYWFDDEGRLTEGIYELKNYFDSEYPEYCLTVFRDLQDELSKKYGSPSAELAEWAGEAQDYDDLLLTLAIVNGELSYTTRYGADNTQIILNLSQDGLSLRYVCIDIGKTRAGKGRDRGV